MYFLTGVTIIMARFDQSPCANVQGRPVPSHEPEPRSTADAPGGTPRVASRPGGTPVRPSSLRAFLIPLCEGIAYGTIRAQEAMPCRVQSRPWGSWPVPHWPADRCKITVSSPWHLIWACSSRRSTLPRRSPTWSSASRSSSVPSASEVQSCARYGYTFRWLSEKEALMLDDMQVNDEQRHSIDLLRLESTDEMPYSSPDRATM
jgi:hypothetical protein